MPEIIFEYNQNFVRNKILKELEKHDKKDQKKIKESTGIEDQYIRNMLQKGESRQDISLSAIALFAKALKRPIEYFIHEENVYIEIIREEFINIPYIESNTDNNNNLIYKENKSMCALRYEWLNKIALSPLDLVIFKVDSDTMENTLFKGDEVIIDTSKKFVKDCAIYAYNSYDFKYIRIRRFCIQINELKLVADNKLKYEPCFASLKDINIIGQVVCSKHVLL